MNAVFRIAVTVAGLAMASHAAAQVTFYEQADFQGRSFTTVPGSNNYQPFDFSERASSAIVQGSRADRWEVCEDRRMRGRCVILQRGEYPSLAALGLTDRVSSVRLVMSRDGTDDNRSAPPPATAPAGKITFYEGEGFRGRSLTADAPIADLRGSGFDDRASSAVIIGERWLVCQDVRYNGLCVILSHGEYPSLVAMGLNDRISSARSLGRTGFAEVDPGMPPPAVPASASYVVFYEGEGFQGRTFRSDASIADFRGTGFNNRASSVVVSGERWEVCEDRRFGGRCVVLRPGQYASLSSMGLNDGISSVREVQRGARIEDYRYSPLPLVGRDYGRRSNERLFEANVTSVRAVVEDSGQRCWVEREQVVQDRSGNNVPGMMLGAVIGGILGHQVGGGSGRDLATGIGVITGAAIGGNARRPDADQQVETSQSVQRCRSAPSQARPAYWDVTYDFRGQEYRVQMTRPPGSTVIVNDQGEPRA